MKIRIFALAKELDIDSKLLIEHCSKAGITIKNSALASISPEERDRVLDIIRSSGAPVATVAAAPPISPVREISADAVGKGRPIRNMIARPLPSRAHIPEPVSPKPIAEVPVVISQSVETAAEHPVAVSPTAQESVQLADQDDKTVTAAEVFEAPVQIPAEIEAERVADSTTLPPDAQKLSPVARTESFTAPNPARPMRQMISRPSSDFSGSKGAPPKKTKAPGLNIAAIPNFKSPVQKTPPKPEEAPAQKPEIRLNQNGIQRKDAAPLQKLINKKTSDSKKRPVDDDEEARKAKHAGQTIEEGRKQRRTVKSPLGDEEKRKGAGARVVGCPFPNRDGVMFNKQHSSRRQKWNSR